MRVQDQVNWYVKARGYKCKPDGSAWSSEQFAARQVAKLCEELGELRRYTRQLGLHDTGWPQYSKWERLLGQAAQVARQAFDEGDWEDAWVVSSKKAAQELADMQVVLFCLADALGVDVVELAREKAAADVERGVR